MNRTLLFLTAAAGLLLAAPALADDSATEADANKEVDDALADKATPPATAPTLPSTASEHAVNALANIAFGKKGEAERLAHSQAGKHGGDAADDALADAANRAAQGAAASAAGAANADAHAAAGQARASTARASHSPITATGGK